MIRSTAEPRLYVYTMQHILEASYSLIIIASKVVSRGLRILVSTKHAKSQNHKTREIKHYVELTSDHVET